MAWTGRLRSQQRAETVAAGPDSAWQWLLRRPGVSLQQQVGFAPASPRQGMPHAPSLRAMDLAIDKARTTGLAAVVVRNSNHFGAAGAYALRAAQAGMVGLVASNAGSRGVVPTRAKEPVFGTNPLAFAAPTKRNRPFVLDMATSTVAIGKVKLAVYNDKPMPAGWLVDDQGRTVTDPTLAFDGHGRLKPGYGVTPLGGLPELSSYKGYGLGAMVEILGSMLTGAPCIGMLEDRNDHQTGHFFLALDPTAFRTSNPVKSVNDRLGGFNSCLFRQIPFQCSFITSN